MTSSMQWADGANGGTPVDAANLNKLAVSADLGTVGTASGEALEDAVAAMLVPGSGMSVTYDDTTGHVELDATGGGSGGGTLATMPGFTLCFRNQNSDGTWPDRPVNRTDMKCIWARTVPGSADPAAATPPAVNGAYALDFVDGV